MNINNVCLSGILISACVSSQAAFADNHTVSVGYAQSKVQDFKNLRGVNVQYRYEWDSPFSVLGSFSYMKGDESYSLRENDSGYDGKTDVKYYSLLAGPAYRINDYVSLYGLAGFAHTKVEDKTTYLTGYRETYNYSRTEFAYGAGVIVNPVDYVSVSVGYEGSKTKSGEAGGSHSINGFNLAVGYRF